MENAKKYYRFFSVTFVLLTMVCGIGIICLFLKLENFQNEIMPYLLGSLLGMGLSLFFSIAGNLSEITFNKKIPKKKLFLKFLLNFAIFEIAILSVFYFASKGL